MRPAIRSCYDGQGWYLTPTGHDHRNNGMFGTASPFIRRIGRFKLFYGRSYIDDMIFSLVFSDALGFDIVNTYRVVDTVMDPAFLSGARYLCTSSRPSWITNGMPATRPLSAKECEEFIEAILADKKQFLKDKRLAAANKMKEDALAQGLSLEDYRKKKASEHKEKLQVSRAQRGQETVEALLKISPHLTRLKEAMARFEKICTGTSDELNMKNIDPSIDRMEYLTKRINGWTRYRKNRNQ